jgi:hypothetical protein
VFSCILLCTLTKEQNKNTGRRVYNENVCQSSSVFCYVYTDERAKNKKHRKACILNFENVCALVKLLCTRTLENFCSAARYISSILGLFDLYTRSLFLHKAAIEATCAMCFLYITCKMCFLHSAARYIS